ncbi:MAG: hypothetical protein AABZ09_05820, partial [Candidatus Binatota bacterium]
LPIFSSRLIRSSIGGWVLKRVMMYLPIISRGLPLDGIGHGEEKNFFPPRQKQSHTNINKMQASDLPENPIKVRLKLPTHPVVDLLEKQPAGLQSTQVNLRGGNGFLAAEKNQVINNLEFRMLQSAHPPGEKLP